VALVSFVEVGVAIYGLVGSRGRGIFFRDAKIVSLSQAMTAIALTEFALTSALPSEHSAFPGISFGLIVGVIIVAIGAFVIATPFGVPDGQSMTFLAKEGARPAEAKSLLTPLSRSKF
jgi:hypothetical protein